MGITRLLFVGALLVPLMFHLFASVEGRFAYSTDEILSASVADDVTPKYDRIKEVQSERYCDDVIDAASELGSNDNRANSIRYDLSFSGGDWGQNPGSGSSGTTRPLMPFVDYPDVSFSRSPTNLSQFRITDVNYALRTKKTIGVNGVLDLTITKYGLMSEMGGRELAPQFQMQMGNTQLSVFFQGVYTESEKNGGERVMCLLGSTMLPDHQSYLAHQRGNMNASYSMRSYEPPLLQDDQILLVLRYPKEFTLTQRAVRGKMRSLKLKMNRNYFDEVHISSQLSTGYKFGSQAVHKACDTYPKSDNLLDDGIDVYKGSEFCSFFNELQGRGYVVIMPNWNCRGTDEFCSKLGPFVTNGKEISGTHEGVQLLMQNVVCEPKLVHRDITMASVSLVLRAAPNRGSYMERMRTGLGNLTLAAEGVWNSSKGQLCMVGCLGIVDAEGNGCDSRVCFYIPTTFSITQRSALVGSISSLKVKTPSYFPLSFRIPIHNGLTWRSYRYTNLRYKYSKIGLAGAILEKEAPSGFANVIKKSLLKFPKLQENEDYNSSASLLADDLTFHVQAMPDPSPSSPGHTYVSMRTLTVGSVFCSRAGLIGRNSSFARVRTPYHEKPEYKMKELLVKVSGQLSVLGVGSSNFSSFSVEGLYDPVVGKMYLIGCRDVRSSSKVLFERNDLDGGYDCSTELVISYPSVTAQWLLNPRAQISIKSTRPEDDALYFKPVVLKTFPITYRRQREDALSEKQIESILRVSTLSVVVVCILLQLFYIRSAVDSVPYASIVMLVIQALGYGIPLITGMEALFKRKHADSYARSYELENSQSDQAIGSTTNILVLVAFLLTLRLLQKVWKSRVRLLRRAPHEPGRVPTDKLVLLVTLVIHIVGFICVLSVGASNDSEAARPVWISDVEPAVSYSISSSSGTSKQWLVLLEEYMGLVQDLFLFPQVVGNLIWQIDCKPLRKVYYVGISMARLLPHVYHYFKASTLNPYFGRDYVFVDRDTDFYSKSSDVFIPVMTVVLAVLVYVQQRWSYNKLSDALVIRRCRLLPLRPKVYQKLPSESVQAELASSSGNRIDTRDQEA